MAFDQCAGERLPIWPQRHRQQTDAEQQIVQFVNVARFGPSLLADFGDGRAVQLAKLASQPGIDAAQRHRPGAPFFQGRVVQKRIGIGVENLVRHRRRRRRIDSQCCNGTVVDGRENFHQAVEIHRFVQTIAHGFFNQGMIGQLDGAAAVVLAHHLLGKHRGQ